MNDNTAKLEQYKGQYIKVNYNVANDVSKPSVLFGGILNVSKRYYQIEAKGDTWIVFTDENILNIWNESPLYIEIG